eukprot:365274-Chlamydomonas_euryale.AAC.1
MPSLCWGVRHQLAADAQAKCRSLKTFPYAGSNRGPSAHKTDALPTAPHGTHDPDRVPRPIGHDQTLSRVKNNEMPHCAWTMYI